MEPRPSSTRRRTSSRARLAWRHSRARADAIVRRRRVLEATRSRRPPLAAQHEGTACAYRKNLPGESRGSSRRSRGSHCDSASRRPPRRRRGGDGRRCAPLACGGTTTTARAVARPLLAPYHDIERVPAAGGAVTSRGAAARVGADAAKPESAGPRGSARRGCRLDGTSAVQRARASSPHGATHTSRSRRRTRRERLAGARLRRRRHAAAARQKRLGPRTRRAAWAMSHVHFERRTIARRHEPRPRRPRLGVAAARPPPRAPTPAVCWRRRRTHALRRCGILGRARATLSVRRRTTRHTSPRAAASPTSPRPRSAPTASAAPPAFTAAARLERRGDRPRRGTQERWVAQPSSRARRDGAVLLRRARSSRRASVAARAPTAAAGPRHAWRARALRGELRGGGHECARQAARRTTARRRRERGQLPAVRLPRRTRPARASPPTARRELGCDRRGSSGAASLLCRSAASAAPLDRAARTRCVASVGGESGGMRVPAGLPDFGCLCAAVRRREATDLPSCAAAGTSSSAAMRRTPPSVAKLPVRLQPSLRR